MKAKIREKERHISKREYNDFRLYKKDVIYKAERILKNARRRKDG